MQRLEVVRRQTVNFLEPSGPLQACNETRHSCQILMKFYFSRQTFEKYSNINFHENPSCGRRAVPSGETDRLTRRSSSSLFANLQKRPVTTGVQMYGSFCVTAITTNAHAHHAHVHGHFQFSAWLILT